MYIEIDGFVDKKLELLKMYASQVSKVDIPALGCEKDSGENE